MSQDKAVSQYNLTLCEGYLYKKGVYNTAWQKRYFVLYSDRTVDYFKDKNCATKRSNAKGTIKLTHIQKVELVQYNDTNNDAVCFLVNKEPNKQLIPNVQHCSFQGVVSSVQTPPEYQTGFARLDLTDQSSNTSVCSVSSIESKESSPELTNRSIFHSIKNDVILTNSHSRRWSNMSSNSNCSNLSVLSEFGNHSLDNIGSEYFQNIIDESTLGLKCDKMYAFALISTERQWILSADNTKDLELWIVQLDQVIKYTNSYKKLGGNFASHTVTQPPQICDGYLNNGEYYVLYANKVLHRYKNESKANIEVDIDLSQISDLKFVSEENKIEIGLSARKNKMSLCCNDETDAKIWYDTIESLFDNRSVIKYYFCSFVQNTNVVHESRILSCRHVGIYTHYMVIFEDKSQCLSIKNVLFFSKRAFREHISNENCILIPLTHNIHVRRASKQNGKYSFCVSNRDGNKKWYFSVKTKEILNSWLDYLLQMKHQRRLSIHNKKAKQSLSSLSDKEIQSVLSKRLPKKGISQNLHSNNTKSQPKKFSQLKQTKTKTVTIPFCQNTDLTTIALSPILDNCVNKSAFPDPFSRRPMRKGYSGHMTPQTSIEDGLNHWQKYLKTYLKINNSK